MIKISQINYQPSMAHRTKMNQSQQFNPQMKNQEPDTVTSPDIGYSNGINFRGVKLDTLSAIKKFLKEPKLSNITSDAVYTIDPNAHIEAATNVVGKYVLRKLPDNKLEQLKAKVLKRAHDMGIEDFRLPNDKHWQANYATQAIDKLMDHKIFNEGNIKKDLEFIYVRLLTRTEDIEKEESESMLEFVDILTAKENERILNNESVQDNLSYIITVANRNLVKSKAQLMKYLTEYPAILDNKTVENNLYNILSPDTTPSKIKFMEYLTKNPEIMDKDIDLGRYILSVNDFNYNKIVKALNTKNPPYSPDRVLKLN